MAPEYENWYAVPNEVKDIILEKTNGKCKFLRRLQNEGLFIKIGDGYVSEPIKESDLEEAERETLSQKAKRSPVLYHVNGFCNSKRHIKRNKHLEEVFSDTTLDNATTRNGHNPNIDGYRGKHRSSNKRKGFEALRRNMHWNIRRK